MLPILIDIPIHFIKISLFYNFGFHTNPRLWFGKNIYQSESNYTYSHLKNIHSALVC